MSHFLLQRLVPKVGKKCHTKSDFWLFTKCYRKWHTLFSIPDSVPHLHNYKATLITDYWYKNISKASVPPQMSFSSVEQKKSCKYINTSDRLYQVMKAINKTTKFPFPPVRKHNSCQLCKMFFKCRATNYNLMTQKYKTG